VHFPDVKHWYIIICNNYCWTCMFAYLLNLRHPRLLSQRVHLTEYSFTSFIFKQIFNKNSSNLRDTSNKIWLETCQFTIQSNLTARTAETVEIGKELPGKSYMFAGNYHSAIQVKSSNTPRIAKQITNALHNFPRWVMMAQYLALWRNSYAYVTIVVSCSRWSRARLQIWHFLSRILKFCYLTHLALFENQKEPKFGFFFFVSFFSRKGLALPKHCPSCIFITNLLTRVYDRAWGKDFAVVLKMFDVSNKKQM